VDGRQTDTTQDCIQCWASVFAIKYLISNPLMPKHIIKITLHALFKRLWLIYTAITDHNNQRYELNMLPSVLSMGQIYSIPNPL